MGEESFQGGVCSGTWWNPPHSLFSGGLSSPCSVAQLGGGGSAFDMGNFGWQNEVMKVKLNSNNNSNNNNQVFDNLIFPDQMDSSLDILGFGLSPTSITLPNGWNHHQNMICNNGSNEGNFGSILQENMNNSSRLFHHGMGENPSNNIMISSTNFCKKSNVDNQQGGASPPMALTASSNSSGDSSTITTEGGGCSGGGLVTSSFPMNSPASYLIQSLFDDSDESQVALLEPQSSMAHNNHFINPSNYGSLGLSNEIISSNTWDKSSSHDNINSTHQQQPSFHSNNQLQLLAAQDNKFNGGMMNGGHEQGQNCQFSHATLSSIRASLLNSLQSRSRGPSSFNQKPHSCAKKVNSEEHRRETKNNSDHDQHSTKRPRIETPSPLPTFKVRKEKLGDRITALQQLVSPFGKTDTASVLHEAIEYIKFLHDQVNVLSTPYLKSGTPMQQQGCERLNENEEGKHDLRSRGLCLVPISSTYPVAQETPVDFWTPTFGGTPFR